MNQPIPPTTTAYDDEIDLFELFQTLWDQKFLILLLTLLFPLIAFIYVTFFDKKPDVFEGKLLIEIASFQPVNATSEPIRYIDNPHDLISIITTQTNVSASLPKSSAGVLLLTMTDLTADHVSNDLGQALEKIKKRHQTKLSNMLDIQVITQTSAVGEIQIHQVSGLEKRNLILAVALVLGGMLGVFIALIRSAVRKRRQSTIDTAKA